MLDFRFANTRRGADQPRRNFITVLLKDTLHRFITSNFALQNFPAGFNVLLGQVKTLTRHIKANKFKLPGNVFFGHVQSSRSYAQIRNCLRIWLRYVTIKITVFRMLMRNLIY